MTFLRVFMGTGNFRCPFGIAAGLVMLRGVFAQTARVRCTCAGLYLRRKRGRRQQRQHHAADEQYAEYSFLHWLFSSCSYRAGLFVPPFF